MEAWWKKIRAMWEIDADKYLYNNKKTMGLDAARWNFFQGNPPLFLSLGVFVYVIDMLGSDEQKQKWLAPTNELAMIGAYA